MSYADYAYYTDSYGGKAVSQEDFLRRQSLRVSR